jgi:YidC/Oxa1 family membrane protein insertase
VVPLLRALKWINGYVGNYGWSIIVLTIIINLVMFPLKHKSIVSMRKMQELQPQVKAIQDRYAKLKVTDPARQKMNTELMELYRQKGVNPASGCVPMLSRSVLIAFTGAGRSSSAARPSSSGSGTCRRTIRCTSRRC